MSHLLIIAALAASVSADVAPPPVGTQLAYRGTLAPVSEHAATDPAHGTKTFDLTLWVLGRGEASTEVFWLVDERGNGGFPWPERFGRVTLDAQLRTAHAGPALLYDRGEGSSPVAVLMPLFVRKEPLAVGGEFEQDELNFHVDRAATAAGRPTWRVSVRDKFGPKRTMHIEQTGPLVLALTERVIMGRGEEYQLKLEFVSAETLVGEPLTALARAIEQLTTMRDKLNLPAASQEIAWKPEQLALLAAQLPPLVKASAGTALSKLATAAERDYKLHTNRNDAVATLRDKFLGTPVEPFSLRGLGDDALTHSDLRGQVTVLHFWDYRDEPLREPYGQVGYLDFMYHRRKAAGMRLFGVAVNGRLGEAATKASAERSVKKLKEFMNLSYPLLLDSGAVLKQFGDPRVLGANLPLFVVIGPEGKIIHYHVGTYEVNQDQGLAELDKVIVDALGKK